MLAFVSLVFAALALVLAFVSLVFATFALVTEFVSEVFAALAELAAVVSLAFAAFALAAAAFAKVCPYASTSAFSVAIKSRISGMSVFVSTTRPSRHFALPSVVWNAQFTIPPVVIRPTTIKNTSP